MHLAFPYMGTFPKTTNMFQGYRGKNFKFSGYFDRRDTRPKVPNDSPIAVEVVSINFFSAVDNAEYYVKPL